MLSFCTSGCPCGFYTDPKKECRCNPNQIQRYLSKISGPLLDSIDIHLEVPVLKSGELLSTARSESSPEIKARTVKARKQQELRFSGAQIFTNAQMTHKQIKKFCIICDEAKSLLKMAIEKLGLSARAHDKVLKVSRTIADLGGSEQIKTDHLAEAIQYRSLDRNFFSLKMILD